MLTCIELDGAVLNVFNEDLYEVHTNVLNEELKITCIVQELSMAGNMEICTPKDC